MRQKDTVADQDYLIYLGIFHGALMGPELRSVLIINYPQKAPIQTHDITSHTQPWQLDVIG